MIVDSYRDIGLLTIGHCLHRTLRRIRCGWYYWTALRLNCTVALNYFSPNLIWSIFIHFFFNTPNDRPKFVYQTTHWCLSDSIGFELSSALPVSLGDSIFRCWLFTSLALSFFRPPFASSTVWQQVFDLYRFSKCEPFNHQFKRSFGAGLDSLKFKHWTISRFVSKFKCFEDSSNALKSICFSL